MTSEIASLAIWRQLVSGGGTNSRNFAESGPQSSSATTCWTAGMMVSQSVPSSRLTVRKSLVPNSMTTPGMAKMRSARGLPAAASALRTSSISSRVTSRVNFMAFGLGVGDASAWAMARPYPRDVPPVRATEAGVPQIEVSTVIDAPPTEVWGRIADVRTHVDWMADARAIRLTSEVTEGVGTTFECDTVVAGIRLTDRM